MCRLGFLLLVSLHVRPLAMQDLAIHTSWRSGHATVVSCSENLAPPPSSGGGAKAVYTMPSVKEVCHLSAGSHVRLHG